MENIVDLIEAMGLQEEPIGVKVAQSRCINDTTAYEIGETVSLTINTDTLFPNGIPRDFSILVTAKPKASKSIKLFLNYLNYR